MEESNTEAGKKPGFFKRLGRLLRNILILAMIIIPCGYAAKLQLRLRESENRTDSLRAALAQSRFRLDSLKLMEDNEMELRDSLDDIIVRRLDDMVSELMITIDTTQNWLIARKAIDETLGATKWVDTLCIPYPEGVAAPVKLRFLQAQAVRMTRLNYRLFVKFPESENPSPSK